MATHHLPPIVTKIVAFKSHVNTYTMDSKDELVIFDFFAHPIPLLFATNVTCDLSKVIKGILIAHVAWN